MLTVYRRALDAGSKTSHGGADCHCPASAKVVTQRPGYWSTRKAANEVHGKGKTCVLARELRVEVILANS